MEKLKNKTILVGREADKGHLLVAVNIDGKTKAAAYGAEKSVPGSVSRCLPGEGIAHCKITVDRDGKMILTNLKHKNVTYVNGLEVSSKSVTKDSTLELGNDKYKVSVNAVLETAKKIVGVVVGAGEFSIKPLEKVYNDYHDKTIEIKKKQKNVGLIRSIPMALTMLGGLVTALGGEDIRPIAMCFTCVALVLMVYGIVESFKDKSIEETDRLTDEFQRKYICPNPECKHFMGNQPYSILRQNKNCPYCKCKFNEK